MKGPRCASNNKRVLFFIFVFLPFVTFVPRGQLFHDAFNQKLKDYVGSYWNKIDILMLSLFGVAMIFRHVPSTNEVGRVLLAFDVFVFYFRQLHIFTISEKLGPKVIMVFKMVSLSALKKYKHRHLYGSLYD